MVAVADVDDDDAEKDDDGDGDDDDRHYPRSTRSREYFVRRCQGSDRFEAAASDWL